MKPKRPHPPKPDRAERDLEVIFGHRAGIALLAKRPQDVTRVACVKDLVKEVETTLGPQRVETTSISVLLEHEIEGITHSPQHEGLCVEAKTRTYANLQETGDLLLKTMGVGVALDRVRNSYNIGAVLRSAAFFGVDAIILGAPAPVPGLDPNAVRVAEGGVEHLLIARTTDLADTLKRLRARGVRVLGADGAATSTVADALKSKATKQPTLLVLGNEREGLGARVRVECDALVAIRGRGVIESLNVAVAAGVLISQLSAAAAAAAAH